MGRCRGRGLRSETLRQNQGGWWAFGSLLGQGYAVPGSCDDHPALDSGGSRRGRKRAILKVTFLLPTRLSSRSSRPGVRERAFFFVTNPLDLGIVEPCDFMPDANALAAYYKARTNEELLNLKREGGFTDEAREIFESELARRKLTTRDLKRYVTDSEHRKLVDEARERGGGYQMPGLRFFGRRYLTEADEKANIQLR